VSPFFREATGDSGPDAVAAPGYHSHTLIQSPHVNLPLCFCS
jgi:hypothetical protein